MSYEPLHHKYRPQTFADLVGQEAIATTLANAIRSERIAPAYLFTGSRGTGKTSTARILAKSLNCKKQDKPTESPCGICEICTSIASGSALDVIEIDAASNTGVDNIREIIERAQFAPVQCRYKVYVVDECHMLSTAAFNALLKTLEEPPARVAFVLATTDPQRVLPTIISRCQRFDFRRIPLEAMVSHLQDIASKENINISPDAITLVAQVAQGGLRDAESLLDQLSLLPGEVTVEAVWDLVGAVPERDLMALAFAIASNSPELVLEQCRRLMDRGREPLIVLQNLTGFYRDLLIAKTAPNRSDLVAVTPPTWNQLREFAKQLDVSSILQSQQHLKNSEAQIKNTTQPRLWLEVTLLGLLPSASQPVETGLRTQSTLPVQRSQTVQPSLSERRETSSPSLAPDRPQNATSVTRRTDSNVLESGSQESRQQSSAPDIDTSTTRSSPTSNSLPSQVEKASPPAPVNSEQLPTTSVVSQSDRSLTPQKSELPQPRSAADAQSANLEQIWQDVLAHVQPPFTQGLLRQHGCLVNFDSKALASPGASGAVARVGISTQPLLKLAQGKLSNIEAAFEAVYKSKVKVILQAGVTESSSTASTSVSSTVEPDSAPASLEELSTSTTEPTLQARYEGSADNPTFTGRQVLSEIRAEAVKGIEVGRETLPASSRPINNSITSSSVSVSKTAPERSAIATIGALSAPLGFTEYAESEGREVTSKELRSDVPPLPASQFSTSPSPQDVDLDADEVEKALGKLKQFFEGEIVELIEDSNGTASLTTERSQDAPDVATVARSEEVIEAVTDRLETEPEELDWIEPATPNQRQFSTAVTSNNSQDLAQFGELLDDDDDIPF